MTTQYDRGGLHYRVNCEYQLKCLGGLHPADQSCDAWPEGLFLLRALSAWSSWGLRLGTQRPEFMGWLGSLGRYLTRRY
jgi:hypothetical protein